MGEKNPLWTGGTGAYRSIAFRVYENKCDICGKTEGVLDVHHRDFDPDHKNNEPENLQILCKKCHCKVHLEHRKNKKREVNDSAC